MEAEEKGDVEALLLESGCRICLLGNTVLLRHVDAVVGSLE